MGGKCNAFHQCGPITSAFCEISSALKNPLSLDFQHSNTADLAVVISPISHGRISMAPFGGSYAGAISHIPWEDTHAPFGGGYAGAISINNVY